MTCFYKGSLLKVQLASFRLHVLSYIVKGYARNKQQKKKKVKINLKKNQLQLQIFFKNPKKKDVKINK